MPIVIKPLLPEQGEEALLFLQPYESECVNLASEILRGGTDCWALYYADQEASQTKTLAGLFALRKKRSLFFCLPFAKYKSAFDKKVCSEAQRPLMEFFESNEPFCVNGEAAGAIFLRNILKNKKSPMRPSVTNKYFLMALEGEGTQDQNAVAKNQEAFNAQNSGGGLRVIQATAADYERLLPLELGYQREEVVPDSFDISDAALAAAFKREIEDGLTFALYDGDRPIAKARVSACGLRHCMLGGVYTIPSERKKGRASFLVRQIIARQSLAFNGFCLYAKQENAAALALYKSLGFVPRGEYLLVYY